MDPDVKNIGKESLVIITKATELFVSHLAVKCSATVALRGARSITEADVVSVIHAIDCMDFLRLDFPKSSVEKKKKITVKDVVVPSGKDVLELIARAKVSTLETSNSGDISQLTP